VDFKKMLDQWERTEKGRKVTEEFVRHAEKRDADHRNSVPELQVRTDIAGLKKMRPQLELDLHGCTAAEAEKQVLDFLEQAARQGLVKVQIVHGKGNHSQHGRAVLKDVVKRCVDSSPYAGQTGTPSAADGGSGATWVAVKRISAQE
jgi:dsDNA-specific endonuclease/ATPase MutS2